MQNKRVLPLRTIIIGSQFVYAMDHAYSARISVHGLKINHLCEFGPMSFVFGACRLLLLSLDRCFCLVAEEAIFFLHFPVQSQVANFFP